MLGEETARSWLIVTLGVLVTAGFRAWLVSRVSTPWIFSDELVHSELAKSIADGSPFRVRGQHLNVTYAYPLVLAPAWLVHSMPVTYALAKAIDVVLVSASALPVYLLGRRFLSPASAAVAAVLTLFLPELALSNALMQENLAFPAYLTAIWGLTLALESPSPGRLAFLIGAVAVAASTRFELLLLVLIVPTAVVLAGAARRLARVLVPFAGAGVALLVLALAEPHRLDRALVVFPQTNARYSPTRAFRWLVTSVGDLALVTGVIPLVALVAMTALRTKTPRERAFLAVTWASLAWFMVLGALAGSWEPLGVKERYFFYVQPMLLLAFLWWVERALPRGVRAALATGTILVIVVWALPLHGVVAAPSVTGNAFGLEVFARIGREIGFGQGLRAVLLGVVVVGSAAALLTGRRAKLALPSALAAFLVVSSAFAYRSADRQAKAVARASALPVSRSWIDDRGRDQQVVLVNTGAFMPETIAGDLFQIWLPWWGTEFWNRSASAVDDLGALEPAPLRQQWGALDWSTGKIVGVEHAPRVAIDPRFEVAGRRLEATSALVLYDRVASPMRLAAATEGVFRDGESSQVAAYDRWSSRVRGPLAVQIALARDVAQRPTRVHIAVGTLAARGATPVIGRPTRRIDLVLDGSATVVVPVPQPPFRIVVRFARVYATSAGALVGGRIRFQTVKA